VNAAELELLLSSAAQSWLEENSQADPHRLALGKGPSGIPLALLCTQLALSQKARHKMPSWAAAGCIFTKRAFEQCSSEAVANAKPWGKGTLALDLTGGLGVDSWAIRSHYSNLISLEPDRDLAAIHRHNARLLGCSQPDVREMSAEAFLQGYDGPPFDLIYLDPDRRDEKGGRIYSLEACSPNVFELMPLLQKHGKRLLIKASPMLDLAAVEKSFGGNCRLHVVAEGGECKEILVEPFVANPGRAVIFLRKGNVWAFEGKHAQEKMAFGLPKAFLFEADTSLYLAGLAEEWFAAQKGKLAGQMTSKAGYFSSDEDWPEFHGHRYQLQFWMEWKPSELKKRLKGLGIKKVQYSRRDFDLGMDLVKKQIGLPEGGSHYLLLFHCEGLGRCAALAARLH
jgi:hypothetical protein